MSFLSERSNKPNVMAGQPSQSELRILVFEDNAGDVELLRSHFKQTAMEVSLATVSRLSEGLNLLEERTFDVVLLDLSLPDSSGIDTLKCVNAVASGEVIIILTGVEDEDLALEAIQTGAQDYLFKDGLSPEMLRRSIRYSMERANLLRQIEFQTREAEYRETLLKRVFNANTDSMLLVSPEGKIQFLNHAASVLLESDEQALEGEIFPFAVRGGEETELEIPGPGQSTKLVRLYAVDLTWRERPALLVTLRDITEYRETQMALKQQRARFECLLESVHEGVLLTDASGGVIRMNSVASSYAGSKPEDAVGRKIEAVLPAKDPESGRSIPDLLEFLENGYDPKAARDPRETRFLVARDRVEYPVSGSIRFLNDGDGKPGGAVVVFRDLSREHEAEEDYFRAEKLQSVSLLAGGIAHDFNNILTSVLGNISVVRMELGEENPNSEKLRAAENAALQAKNLTQQLLAFSKGGAPVFEATTIERLAEDCAQFILRGSNVKCECECEGELWPVEVDKGQIAQVINNLLINADQAMPDGGVIHLRTRNVSLKTGEIEGLRAGDYVAIEIKDEGEGISSEQLGRIFDPYFTTKEKGNGLGLASSNSIVKRHGGRISVDSKEGLGACFTIYLPKTSKSKPEARDEEKEEGNEEIHRGTGRILVMDDMEAMMTVAGEILNVLGYEVEFSTDGSEAIDVYKKAKEEGNPFDAVVFDLTVPGGMGGEEACRILRQYDPHLVAIASSGYTTASVMSDYERAGFQAVVPKPYRIKEMSAALRRILR